MARGYAARSFRGSCGASCGLVISLSEAQDEVFGHEALTDLVVRFGLRLVVGHELPEPVDGAVGVLVV